MRKHRLLETIRDQKIETIKNLSTLPNTDVVMDDIFAALHIRKLCCKIHIATVVHPNDLV
ncbi:hypothetical protein BNJ_00097 [Kaumoebavirus]|uniref:hypothetical protein n=1 Tax=Kaumoebavirus TaxID=1859492 RepID=UPI0009C1FE4B|nr:hypothetical protein BNJ_00097 [Kaumoebavirus]ARA71935.1 hypothetical protein BNJ_00097 [Kaumoebavirus]